MMDRTPELCAANYVSSSGVITDGRDEKMSLTTKELDAIEEQLRHEQVLVKKYRAFSQQCSDAQLKATCNRIADKHQQHFNTLMGFLQ